MTLIGIREHHAWSGRIQSVLKMRKSMLIQTVLRENLNRELVVFS